MRSTPLSTAARCAAGRWWCRDCNTFGGVIGPTQDGLDVTRPEEMTAAEIEAYRAEYTGSNKGLLDSFEFWLEFRPDVLKRHKARTRHYSSPAEPAHHLVGLLGAIHQYTIMAFREG